MAMALLAVYYYAQPQPRIRRKIWVGNLGQSRGPWWPAHIGSCVAALLARSLARAASREPT